MILIFCIINTGGWDPFRDDSERRPEHNLTKEQSAENIVWIQAINDLEHICDIIRRMLKVVTKKSEHQVSFSAEGKQELRDFFADVIELTESITLAIGKREVYEIEQVAQQAISIINKERSLRISQCSEVACSERGYQGY